MVSVEGLLLQAHSDSTSSTREFRASSLEITHLANLQRESLLLYAQASRIEEGERRLQDVRLQRSLFARQLEVAYGAVANVSSSRLAAVQASLDRFGSLLRFLGRYPKDRGTSLIVKKLTNTAGVLELRVKAIYDQEELEFLHNLQINLSERATSQRALLLLGASIMALALLLAALIRRSVRSDLQKAYVALVKEHEERIQLEAQQKVAAEVLREAQERFRSAFDNAPYGMVVATPDGRFVQVNKSFCEILGYAEDDLLVIRFQDITHPEELDDAMEKIRRLLDGDVRAFQMEKRNLHADGHYVRISVSVSLVRDPRGEPLYLIAQIEDVTNRNKLEEQLRQSQKLDAVGQLAGGIAHDFNNLLSVIQSYARFVMESLDENDPAMEDAREIVKAGDRATSLVRRLLAFSRREVTQPEIVNLNDAIMHIDKLLQRTISADIELVTDLSPDIMGTKIDPANLEQVVLNIALNARDAMPQHGGRLTIRTENLSISEEPATTAGVSPGDYVLISIADTGCGISPDVVDRIFEPFFTTKSRGRGTGLGLATVYGIVQQAGGAISVESRVNLGTTFEILLPASGDMGEVNAPAIPPIPGRGSESILVAEDEGAVRRLVERVLSKHGYTVRVAASGLSALELCETDGYGVDLLVTDVIMPGMSGKDLAESMRESHEGIEVLFMSGYPGETLVSRGVFAEGESYLQKPFTSDQLLAAVRRALDPIESELDEVPELVATRILDS